MENKYKLGASCKKCGERGATSKYQSLMGIEHIKRVCKNCGHTWYEEPLNT